MSGETTSVRLTIVRAKDLKNVASFGGKNDPYVKIIFCGSCNETDVKRNAGSACEWNSNFNYDTTKIHKAIIYFEVMNKNTFNDNTIGNCKLVMSNYFDGKETHFEKDLHLTLYDSKNNTAGNLDIRLTIDVPLSEVQKLLRRDTRRTTSMESGSSMGSLAFGNVVDAAKLSSPKGSPKADSTVVFKNTLKLTPSPAKEALHGPVKRFDKDDYAKLMYPHVQQDGNIQAGQIMFFETEDHFNEGKVKSELGISPTYEYMFNEKSLDLSINEAKGGKTIMRISLDLHL